MDSGLMRRVGTSYEHDLQGIYVLDGMVWHSSSSGQLRIATGVADGTDINFSWTLQFRLRQ